VVLGFTVPVLGRFGQPAAELFEHTMRPISAGFAVPVFAFFAAGVTVGGWSGLGASFLQPVTIGVMAALVLGKPIGVFVTTFLLARFTGASLDEDLA
jgi:NhaA family Na+:H+ antiporter